MASSVMYTKEGEFEVALTGGSPWGFTIRSQSGNGYNRGRVIVGKVVQGGKADASGKIHVGDEILAVNGAEFDNEQQATEYVKIAKKELILKVKRGQDKRRMNIRLAGELPNYYATALESPFEHNLCREYITDSDMFSDRGNNKRSSKEYEKDLSYKASSDIANAIIDYQTGQVAHSSEHNRMNLRLTQSSTDLSDYSNDLRDESWSESSPSWKNNNCPISPDKVQRVRIRSTNVTTPDHYKKVSPGNERLSQTINNNQRHAERRSPTPGYSPKGQRTFSSSVLEDLNRTWPSVSSSEVSGQDALSVPYKSLSVSAVKSHFEHTFHSRKSEPGLVPEVEQKQKSGSTSPLAPTPPSRNSSFRSSRLSSSTESAVAKGTPEKESSSPDLVRQNSLTEKARPVGYEKDYSPAHVRQGSSSEDFDKPIPPKRFSQSKVLTSFRSSKKPANRAKTVGPSTVYDRAEEEYEKPATAVYHHTRTQSLPSSRIVATHLSSKSWVANEEDQPRDSTHREFARSDRLPRSSSFSRAHVLETSSVETVQLSDARQTSSYATRSSTRNFQNESDVIQAQRTGEQAFHTKFNSDLRSRSTPFLKQGRVNGERDEARMGLSRNEQQVTPEPSKTAPLKPVLRNKNEPYNSEKSVVPQSKPEVKGYGESQTEQTKAELSNIPLLKENSIMQRLLMESQGQDDSPVFAKTIAIKQEISQRSIDTTSSSEPNDVAKVDSGSSGLKQQRSVKITEEDVAQKELKQKVWSDSSGNRDEGRVVAEGRAIAETFEEPQVEMKDSKDVKQSAVKVDRYLDKLMVKLESPPVTRRSFPANVSENPDTPASVEDDVFEGTASDEKETGTDCTGSEMKTFEDNVTMMEDTKETPTSGLVESSHELTREIVNSSPEIVVKSEEVITESCPPELAKDDNDNISEFAISENTELDMNVKIKKIDLRDNDGHSLSPGNHSLKVVHSRDNSASSLLEETLESARTIASIYSVEGPTRSVESDDSVITASEMRRYSLAKRVLRKKHQTDYENPLTKKPEFDGDRLPSCSTPHTVPGSFHEPESPIHESGANLDEDIADRSAGSVSSNGSTPGSISSPKLEALEEQKEILISSMKKKVELLKEQENEINEEMKQNDDLGLRVADNVKTKTSGSEFSKFQLFVGELNNIIGLLLSLTQRMHRYEVMLQDVDLAEENGREKRDVLLKRIDRVKQQYEEACRIKEINDKRGETVAKFVEEYCSDEEFADFQHFVDMKTQLALTQAEIKDKIKLGEEKLNALTSAQIDWRSFDLSSR